MDDNVGGGQGSSTVAGEVGCAIGGGDFNGGWWDGLCDRRTRTWALGQETAATPFTRVDVASSACRIQQVVIAVCLRVAMFVFS